VSAFETEFSAGHQEHIERIARAAARDEIASMAGLVLRRAQEQQLTRNPITNEMEDTVNDKLATIFGEVLSDFSGHTGGGQPGN